MPKVEQYGGSQISTEVVQGARAKNFQIAGVGDFAPGVSQLAQGLQQMQERADTAAAEEALVAFEREKNNLFFNPETGYFNTQGRDAMDGAEQMTQSLAELRDRYAQGLKSSRAQAAFSRAAEAHITRGNVDIMRHAQAGAQAWEVATINSRIENTVENASLYWNDPDRLAVQNELGRQSIMDNAQIEGVTGEALNERLQTYESTFASSVITAATTQSSEQGRAMLEEYGERLEGPDRLKMDELIAKRERAEQTERENRFAVTQATALIQQYGDLPDARARINEEINQIEDPEVRRAASREATRQLDIRIKAQGEQRVAIQEEVEDFILMGGTAAQYAAANPDNWNTMSAQQRRALTNGEGIVTDYEQFYDLLALPQDQLAQLDASQYAHSLAPDDRRRLETAIVSARRRSPESQTGRTRAQQITGVVTQLFGSKPRGGYRGTKAQQVDLFYSIVDAERQRREDEKGATLTSVEFTAMLNEMTRTVTSEGALWDTEYELRDIPPEDLQVLTDHLRQNNIPLTGDNLIRAYIQATQ